MRAFFQQIQKWRSPKRNEPQTEPQTFSEQHFPPIQSNTIQEPTVRAIVNGKLHTPRMYCRITVPPLGGGWCLMCGNIINLHRAALESVADEINHLATRLGYLEGISDPAVFWLNSLCASTGVGIIHSMLSGFLDVDNGLDWIYEFPGSNWLKANPDYLGGCGCYFCGA